ncbi:hypothetical protein ACOJIV_27820, partial [Haloarcula sp. AONF1]
MTTSHDTKAPDRPAERAGRRPLDRLRRPEYTGANRCLPCTAVNVCIAVGAALAAGGLVGPGLGAGVFVASLAAIWLRGYLVPGTLELTKRYLPERALRLFGKGRDTGPPPEIDAESYLLSADVLVETPDGTDLAFAPWFESAWRTHLAALRDAADTAFGGVTNATAAGDEAAATAPDGTRPASPADVTALARLTGIDEDGLSLRWLGEPGFAHAGNERIGHWESRSAFLADVAADRALAAHLDD